MKSREQKYQAIWDRAIMLDAKGKTETFLDLAKWLNKNGFRTNAGTPYAPAPRGIAKVVAEAWAYAEDKFGRKKALPIAHSFTGQSGEHSWTD